MICVPRFTSYRPAIGVFDTLLIVTSERRVWSVALSLSVAWSACAEQPSVAAAIASAAAAMRKVFFMLESWGQSRSVRVFSRSGRAFAVAYRVDQVRLESIRVG